MDKLLEPVLDGNNIIQIMLTCTFTSTQHSENWELLFNNDKCIGLLRNNSLYKRCTVDGEQFIFKLGETYCNSCKSVFEPLTIKLYPYEAQVTGEIRKNIEIGEYKTTTLCYHIEG